VQAEKVRARKAARRRRQWTVGGTVVAVIAVAAGVAIVVNASNHKTPYAAPVSAVVDPITKSSKDLGILVGSSDAPVKMTVFEDFRCPACQAVEGLLESTYKQYISDGKLQVTYHPVRLIDNKNGGQGSLRAGNAAACAQDAGQFMAMHDVFYANQPSETTDGYGTNVKLLALASEIPALKGDAAFVDCVNKGTHDGWVNDNADVFNKIGLDSTPTIFLDGTKYAFAQNATNDQALATFKADLDKAFTKDGGKAGTPVTLPTAPPSALTPSGAASSGASGAPTSAPSGAGTPTASESATEPKTTPSASSS
jgi:protein-disulfide isomerase